MTVIATSANLAVCKSPVVPGETPRLRLYKIELKVVFCRLLWENRIVGSESTRAITSFDVWYPLRRKTLRYGRGWVLGKSFV
jgi:hypothetical protein